MDARKEGKGGKKRREGGRRREEASKGSKGGQIDRTTTQLS